VQICRQTVPYLWSSNSKWSVTQTSSGQWHGKCKRVGRP